MSLLFVLLAAKHVGTAVGDELVVCWLATASPCGCTLVS
jgi:hypothetical protein